MAHLQKDKPMAVGGKSMISTANYVVRYHVPLSLEVAHRLRLPFYAQYVCCYFDRQESMEFVVQCQDSLH